MQRNTTVISPEQVQHQLELCRQVARLTAQWPQKPLAFVDTYGCQQNEAGVYSSGERNAGCEKVNQRLQFAGNCEM